MMNRGSIGLRRLFRGETRHILMKRGLARRVRFLGMKRNLVDRNLFPVDLLLSKSQGRNNNSIERKFRYKNGYVDDVIIRDSRSIPGCISENVLVSDFGFDV